MSVTRPGRRTEESYVETTASTRQGWRGSLRRSLAGQLDAARLSANWKESGHCCALGGWGLFGFLNGFDVRFEGGGILVLRLEIGLEFFHEELEAANFVAQFLEFCGGRRSARERGGRGHGGARGDG